MNLVPRIRWLVAMSLLLAVPPIRAADMPDHDSVNPLVAPWPGPFGGVPPFDKVGVADLAPALEAVMAAQLAALESIAANPAAPSFDNTVVAMEREGRGFERVATVYGIYGGCLSDEAVRAVEREMAPKLAAFADAIFQNRRLFDRIRAVYETRETAGLTAEQQRLCWHLHGEFVRGGAALDEAGKAEVSRINERLAALSTAFSQNVLQDENEGAVLIDDKPGLAGLPATFRAAAAEAAEALGHAGRWAIQNTRSSVEPFLAYAERRDLRERVWRMFVSRGDGGGATDNNAIIAETMRLRSRRAKLLGFPTHAHWQLENSMARSPDRATALMDAVWGPAVKAVAREVADMQAVADAERAGITIEPWDYRYYAEKVRKARYDLDEAEVTPYLQLENLRKGMFHVAGRLFDLHFTPVPEGSVPVYHPDVRVWEVKDGRGGHVGLWYFDPFARQGKRSGAWMSGYRSQERIDGDVSAIVSNNCNFVKPPPGVPATISWEDATTLFHEFGHALHGLCSNVTYPTLAGTNVARDYVEFPSQLLEHWLETPEILERYAIHAETGRPIPADLVRRIKRAATFNRGFKTVEFLASAIVDMRLHLGDPPDDPARFERETLAAIGMPREIVMRHRTPHFSHIFSGDGYSAAYYSYLWADTLTADAWEAFTEGQGPWDSAVARRLKAAVFSVGNTIDPDAGWRQFRGRDVDPAALMRKRGFSD